MVTVNPLVVPLAACPSSATLRRTAVPQCLLCKRPGASFYTGLRGARCGVRGLWNMRRCPGCALLWLDPRPAGEDLTTLYADYYTHGQGSFRGSLASIRDKLRLTLFSGISGYEVLEGNRVLRGLARLALRVPAIEEMARLGLMGLGDACGPQGQGRLLDVGCGSGRFLSVMRRCGWQVDGVEPDPAAARVAFERHGVIVRAATIAQAAFADASFDAITLSHVIEHVEDPMAVLVECRRMLRPGGRLALSTPNPESRGHRRFGRNWLHLDVPRHLHLFSRQAVAGLLERAGFRECRLTSAAKSAASTWLSSTAIARGGAPASAALAWAVAFHLSEWRAVARGEPCGEEIFAWAA